MNWTDFERYLSDLTAFSLAIAFVLHGLGLRFRLHPFARTAMGIAWLSSGIVLVGHLALTGRFDVWWLALWWLFLWFWSLEIPLETRTLGLPASLLGLLFLWAKAPAAFPLGWPLATSSLLLLGMMLLDFAFLAGLFFLLTRRDAFKRTTPWLAPELVETLISGLSLASTPFLTLAIFCQIPAPNWTAVLSLSLALSLTIAAALKRGNLWLLLLSGLAAGLAASSLGLLRSF